MLSFLRLIGITNAAIWFGAAFFHTLFADRAFTPEEMPFLPETYAVAAGHVLLKCYFALQSWCGGIALLHLMVEWLYAGRPLRRWSVYLVLFLFGWNLLGNFWLQPKLNQLHVEIHGIRSNPQQRQQSQKAYPFWNGFAKTVNFLGLFGLFGYLWQITGTGTPSRFIGTPKFRS